MSSFLKVSIVNDFERINTLKVELLEYSEKEHIGVFFENRYIELFESELSKKHFCFSLADSNKFDNCEFLLTPWWFQGHSIEQFDINFDKIAGVLELCLNYFDVVDLWVGTSGDLYTDFKHTRVTLNSFINNIKDEYQLNLDSDIPSIHYTIVR